MRIFSLDQKNNNIKLYPIENLRLWFILIIFLKFCKFQPRYSYKIYSNNANLPII